ncbi:claudin-7-like [Styela clava]|uniref:claudin-7-like n=1 Tax=Styela clava TaxID=7725 RepID=UPI00193A70FE|nr:claudin-7-like [Styela clava]
MGHGTTAGFGLAALSLVGIMYCIISNEWKRSSQLASQQSLKFLYLSEGLWMRCTVPTPGIMQCDNYSTALFDVEQYLQALRAMMILSGICMFAACVLDCLAMDCINCVEERNQLWLARVGGVLAVLAGLLCVASVSWYASEVIKEFRYDFIEEGIKYTFGSALYVGWVAGGFAVISGCITACCNCISTEDERLEYSYKPPKSKPKTSEEYV